MGRKLIKWNEEKNQILKIQRGVRFEQVLDKIISGEIAGRQIHPNKKKYPDQQIFILELNSYFYYIPFVETENEIFLKTIIPSRKLTKQFGGEENEE